MIKNIMDELKKDMEKTIDALMRSLVKIRTGRASIGILEGIMVDYYGTLTPLNQLATLATPEPRLITIQPWDKGATSAIEKAVLKSDLGLTPANDGKIIRIPIPPLTEERRKDLVKVVKRLGEDFRIEIRKHRRNTNNLLKDTEQAKKINKDELKKSLDDVQEITNNFIKKIDNLLLDKEKEIMEI
ncbi:MAG: ribosome recycling factor [Deltaproteobacteria bacterium]|nr:ribosome recycling factor [Deltaproteobacteria bacterium]